MINKYNINNEHWLSEELTEHPDIGCTVHNERNKYNWCIRVNPPIERNDIIYFCIYEKDNINERCCPWTADRCARISMISPYYINCSDSGLPNWILSDDQISYLVELLTRDNYRIWNNILYQYKFQLNSWDGREISLDISLPNYYHLLVN